MPHHEWGDGWFQKYDYMLSEAMKLIQDLYHKETKKHVCMKEKYGEIRYEFIGMIGVITEKDCEILDAVITKVADKFPEIEDEIKSDWGDTYSPPKLDRPNLTK